MCLFQKIVVCSFYLKGAIQHFFRHVLLKNHTCAVFVRTPPCLKIPALFLNFLHIQMLKYRFNVHIKLMLALANSVLE